MQQSAKINYLPLIALARLDIVHQWLEFRKQSQNKLKADYDFVKLHNTSNSHLFEILGKISRGSLHRWYAMLNGTGDYTKLLPQYKYSTVLEYRTVLNDEEIKIFMGLLLHPNRLSIGKAIALTKYKLKEQGQNFIPADITFRRYAKWFKDNNYDKWILARDGEKALSDKVEPYIKRDASLLEVGDILVADGHKLAFQVINPFTGKPCRATLVGFLDWKSTALVGYSFLNRYDSTNYKYVYDKFLLFKEENDENLKNEISQKLSEGYKYAIIYNIPVSKWGYPQFLFAKTEEGQEYFIHIDNCNDIGWEDWKQLKINDKLLIKPLEPNKETMCNKALPIEDACTL